ncbi:MAG: hypothetical protein OXF31_11845 [Gammaproteobacteria bacterium]|nr:hypothetical protein [Gammaproteobacteria bacterium]
MGFLASSYVATLPILREAGVVPMRSQFVAYLPEAFSFAAFSLLFYAVPNCRVKARHALAGAAEDFVDARTSRQGARNGLRTTRTRTASGLHAQRME